jgi:hypothetical protein
LKLTPTDWAALATFVLAAIFLASRDDPRAWRWLAAQWRRTVGAWCKRRRSVIRVPRPDEHSPGIMVARRDINTGVWT